MFLAGAATLLLATTATAQVQNSAPQPLPMPPAIAAPRDVAYPGTIKLQVDATDLDRRIYRVKQTVPVEKAGPMTLLYTKWLPGAHSPSAPLHNYVGLTIKANGKTVPWKRDVVDVHAFHITVPQGAKELEIEAQYLTAVDSSQGGALITKEMLRLQWYATALYPAGHFTRRIMVEPSVKLPTGWGFGVALDEASRSGDTVTFKPVSFETLADSPMFAGKYYRQIDLDPGGRSPVKLNIVADAPENLEAKPEVIEIHRELVRQADKLYGARHFNRYDFLLSLSSRLGGSGLEHHRSSENGVSPNYFTTWDTALLSRDLLPHEYTHSWNGKYRRGADLWTPNFSVPMRDSLLWVYEGQTQYWGFVLAARAGFLTKEQTLDSISNVAAFYDNQPGRQWRPLIDTTNDPIIQGRRSIPYDSWQRSEEYYQEGQLIWLEVDTLIRERSNNARSLDDFAKAFFGVNDADWGVLTYQFEDVAATLNKIEPYDWSSYLKKRLEEPGQPAFLDGITRGGYRLAYLEEPNSVQKANEARNRNANLMYAIGASFNSSGGIVDVQWDGPVFKAGLTTGMTITAVNGESFDIDRLKAAVRKSKDGTPVELLIRQNDGYRTVKLDYAGGLRYPRLERVAGTPDRLGDILAKR